jgi:hypothetical protein
MLSERQQRIHDGLKNIGEALANFYLDGLKMAAPECNISSKANMIAHAAREIDGGLRDVFAPQNAIKKVGASLPNYHANKDGHFVSILASIGKNDANNLVANKWLAIAKNFHRIAHRKHIHSKSVDASEIIEIWAEYEKVLDFVIGSFLSITNRLDILLALDKPPADVFPVLKNLLSNPRHAQYFFSHLDKPLWLKPLKEEGFFDADAVPKKAAENYSPDYWFSVKYLLNICKTSERNVQNILIEIVNDIMKFYISGTALHSLTVSHIVDILINLDEFSFGENERAFIEKYDTYGDSWSLVHSQLTEGFAAKLILKKDIDGLSNLLIYFFGFTTHENPAISFFGEEAKPYYVNKPNVEKYYINELLNRHSENITQLLGIDAIKIAIRVIEDLTNSGSYNLSYGSPPSIEETSQTVYSDDWEDLLVYFIRDNSKKLTLKQLSTLIDELLDSKIQVLQRLGIHLIWVNFHLFKFKWWHFVDSTGVEDNIYIHEPYKLIQEYSSSFNDAEFEKVISWIERLNPPELNDHNSEERRYAGSRIRRWLTSLRPATDLSNRLLTDKEVFYRTWFEGKISDHPEFDSYGTSHFGPDYPMEVEDYKKLTISEQIQFILSYKPEQEHDSSEEGLAELLKYEVMREPDKYLYSLTDFIPLHSLYLSYLLQGLTEALRKEKITDYSLVLDFIEVKLSDISFTKEHEKKFLYKRWLGMSIAEFLVTVSHQHQQLEIKAADINRMVALLLSIINNPIYQDSEKIKSDYINHVLNSTPGRFYLSVIELTKMYADKFSIKDEEAKWPTVVKQHFTQLVDSHEAKDYNFSIILGMEMQFLLYLDKTWVEKHVNKIFDDQNTEHFKYRLHSTLNRASPLSEYFYRFFKKHNLFTKALKYLKHESLALRTVMAYALLEWKVWRVDLENDSILSVVLEKKDPEQIRQLVRVVFERKLLSKEELNYLWERLMPIFDSTPALLDYYPILLWIFGCLPEIEYKSFCLASKVIAKINNGREVYSFLRHLYEIADSNIELAGKLVQQVYVAKLVTPFYEVKLKSLVDKLYKSGYKEIADDICIQLAEQGSLELKELYNKNN